jgi:hypothetical protein
VAGRDGLLKPANEPQGDAEAGQRPGFAVPVAGFPVDGGGALEGRDGLLEPSRPAQGGAKVGQRRGFAVPVAEPTCGVQADGGGGQPVIDPVPPVKALSQRQPWNYG